jgi:hypothetical protein
MKQLLFLLIISLPLCGYSQPGYLGNKISVAYNFEATPIPAKLYAYNYYGEPGSGYPPGLFFQTGHSIVAGYTTSRKIEFFGSFSFRNFKCYMSNALMSQSPRTKSMLAHQSTFELGFCRYLKSYIAPVGSYYKMSLGFLQANYDKSEKDIRFNNVDSENATVQNNFPVLQIPQFSFGIGLKKPITNRLFVQLDAQMNILLTALTNKGYIIDYTFSEKNYFDECLQRSFNMIKVFNTRIGIGFFL